MGHGLSEGDESQAGALDRLESRVSPVRVGYKSMLWSPEGERHQRLTLLSSFSRTQGSRPS